MAKKIDLTGQRFGRWLVLGEAEKKDSRRRYLCRCECGTEKIIGMGELRSGDSRSCGCLKRELTSKRFTADLTGRTYGRITVIRRHGKNNSKGQAMWECSCSCGNKIAVVGSKLTGLRIKSCGCLRDKDEGKIGRRYGMWTVVGEASPNCSSHSQVLCECKCGSKRYVSLSNLTGGKSLSCGCAKGTPPTREDKLRVSRESKKRPLKARSITLSKIPPCDSPTIKDGVIQVRCKMCGKIFAPSRRAITSRILAYEGVRLGESNLYCSEACKNACPLYNHKTNWIDPRIAPLKADKQKTRACRTRSLRQLQCDETGHNYCERCGDIIDVELHHTVLVSKDPTEAINPAGHMLLCAGCHLELHRSCG